MNTNFRNTVLFLPCFILLSLLSTDVLAQKDVEQLILNKNSDFDYKVSSQPNGFFEATLSFAREVPIDEAIEKILSIDDNGNGRNRLTITGFFHADENSESGGAYIIPYGESLDESVINYINGMKAMYQNHIASIRHQLASELSSDVRVEYEKLLDHRLEDYDDLNASGMFIIGIILEGSGESLDALKRLSSDFVRVTSITDPGFVESAITPWE